MVNLLNKDSHLTGIIIGLILPIIGFILAFGLTTLIDFIGHTYLNLYLKEFQMIGIAFNLWPIRYYFVKKKHELTGRGILLVTFIYIIAFFAFQ